MKVCVKFLKPKLVDCLGGAADVEDDDTAILQMGMRRLGV